MEFVLAERVDAGRHLGADLQVLWTHFDFLLEELLEVRRVRRCAIILSSSNPTITHRDGQVGDDENAVLDNAHDDARLALVLAARHLQ